MSKSAKYFYDADAVREDSQASEASASRAEYGRYELDDGAAKRNSRTGKPDYLQKTGNDYGGRTRNRRSVWEIATQPFPEGHFATFPEKLVEPCILAGTSAKGACPECGAPWVRVVEKTTTFGGGSGKAGRTSDEVNAKGKWAGQQYGENIKLGPQVSTKTTGWEPSCGHGNEPVPCIVFDPFGGGSGRVHKVAFRHGRMPRSQIIRHA